MLLDFVQTWPPLAFLLPGALLYAEMHYRWWPLPSRYFRREPEILADAPRRLEPGLPLPLLLLVKDAHRYPIFLERVLVEIETPEGRERLREIAIGQEIGAHWWHREVVLERPAAAGDVSLWVTFHYTVRGRRRNCTTHNLPTLKPRPLQVYLAKEPLPGENVIWGDLHHHTFLTEDMVEFGAPLEATRRAATAAGLGFVCATDHSYDLDDIPGDWRAADPALAKWHTSRKELAALNPGPTRRGEARQDNGPPGQDALLVPSEEVSIRNILGKTVHALVLGHPEFLPGSGDGGERPLKVRSELDVEGLAARLSSGALAMAAHPYYPVPFLQRLLLGRGRWENRDVRHPVICGLQILNGRLDRGFFQGVAEWKGLLLQGHRKFIYAGSDAHGNFNRYRQIRLPFLALEERRSHILGACRTGVLDVQPGDMAGILAGLKAGRCIISTGPFINLHIATENQAAVMGETIRGREVKVSLEMASSSEFGPLANFRLLSGRVGQAREEVLAEAPIEGDQYRSHWEGAFELQPGTTYFRAEVETKPSQRTCLEGVPTHLALTNPVWVERG